MEEKPLLLETIETEKSITKVYDNGLVESYIKEEAYIDVPFLVSGKQTLEELNLAKKFYVISEGMGFFRISKEAKVLSASAEYSSHIAAIAVITSHVATRLVLDFYNKVNKPVVPTKGFTDRTLALKWLEEQMKISATG